MSSLKKIVGAFFPLSTSLGPSEPMQAEDCGPVNQDYTGVVHSFIDAVAQTIQNLNTNKVNQYSIVIIIL